jgi:hypothetical protein
MIVNKLLTVRDNNLSRRTIICQRGQIIWQVTLICEFTNEQGQQLDLNLRPSDYKSDALPLCYAGGWCWREDFFIPSPITHYSLM